MQIRGVEKLRERFFSTTDHSGTILDESPMYFEKQEAKKPAPKTRKYQRHEGGKLGRKNELLTYLAKRGSKKTSYQKIAKDLGIQQGYVSVLITDLLAKRAVTRRGKRGAYIFSVKQTRVNKPRRAKRAAPKTVDHVVERAVELGEAIEKHKAKGYKSTKSIEKVYDYIARNEDRLMSQEDICRATGYSTGAVGRAILQLVEDKRIVRSDPLPRHGSRYWLYEHIETGVPVEEAPQPKPEPKIEAKTDASHLVKLVDGLTWEFIKETGSISVVDFVGWLERKNN